MKTFNTTGKCIPSIHYMVDISVQVSEAAKLVHGNSYFCINRGRQFGKTTTLSVLRKQLIKEYTVFSMSFESFSDAKFQTVETLLGAIVWRMADIINFDEAGSIDKEVADLITGMVDIDAKPITEESFAKLINQICKINRCGIVLIIDEVDQASNFPSFIKFLGILRDLYLNRDNRPTFQSVVLAGVYDVKNLKLKIREGNEIHYNSPWNIAVPFDISMSFAQDAICKMLKEYEADKNTGMNCMEVAGWISEYTSGYPFYVARICQIMDKAGLWDKEGFLSAVKALLKESNTLFDDTSKKLHDFPELGAMIRNILFSGEEYPANAQSKIQEIGRMFNFLEERDGKVAIVNRIQEIWFYNYFFSEDKEQNKREYDNASIEKPKFINEGKLNIELIFERFAALYSNMYDAKRDGTFDENEGRKKFLFFIKPIINGTGNFYTEAQTRNLKRTDLIIDYLGEQYIIELKIWHGEKYNHEGEMQLADYLEAHGLQKGYMLTFNFNKNKTTGITQKIVNGKEIVELVV